MNPQFPSHQPNLYNIVPTQLSQPLPIPPTEAPVDVSQANLTKAQRRMLGESEAARAKRLAKNAERMRQKRATETYDEYKIRLAKNAETNRRRRQNETEAERALRHMRNAMRQRLRRAMETPEQKAIRKARLAQRMREIRANETPEQRKLRLEKGAARARHKFLSETSDERTERNRKKAEYARTFRNTKQQNQPDQIEDLATKSATQSSSDIKSEQAATNSVNPLQQVQTSVNSDAALGSREQNYHSVKNYPINYPEFGAAFPTFFNYPHLKNGQQSAYSPVYPTQTYYPELSVPPHYMKNDRAPYATAKDTDCPQFHPNPLKEAPQKN
ncbi:uncharacterized protein C05D11.13-like isoform X2 [Topomyia yanbarensis]|uniref:uncharacterized protein C05D11.13-like isoform X2 n=1 Tax=Topomyia yanbarensis TaxID=2498891 RepID=UPI00273B1403|nr:uncharacterized protein C05D11.13-like isoform X2 [Topomyia yanbarensis]XP_058821218.1 uncharacterized protein C05D11.13-like isoform X2 [Topomyia yanbarensis]